MNIEKTLATTIILDRFWSANLRKDMAIFAFELHIFLLIIRRVTDFSNHGSKCSLRSRTNHARATMLEVCPNPLPLGVLGGNPRSAVGAFSRRGWASISKLIQSRAGSA